MSDPMRLDIVDRVARLTIDRPEKRNAMSGDMWQALLRHVRTIERTPDVAAVVLSGSGGNFSAGGDLAELSVPDPDHVAGYRRLAETAVLALTELAPPKLAEIDGPCFGAGCSLALACDVRICSPAAQFRIPALGHGLTYEPVFVQRLVRAVGSGPAGLLLYGGERWTAAEAAAYGLVDRCTPDVAGAVERILAWLRGADGDAIASTAMSIRTASRSR
ncbi:enoyl-CoA hydratase/isomerase family protein [Amycolatopsis thermophila]|uniref:Enoyl-CoA hydratase/carnithine racemase n=1 Tax=Amycolatopsis thermophila TaxID=206084 RepID=A0ABU0F1E9_9PSEU|nr:enoyl-CoA hydratase/isomerase family protein [Amycolatopsis thermophila]MDQ0381404.1 enoyl-CoA hydratase/carnithine racemase [Amycolatopsis thermophila]